MSADFHLPTLSRRRPNTGLKPTQRDPTADARGSQQPPDRRAYFQRVNEKGRLRVIRTIFAASAMSPLIPS